MATSLASGSAGERTRPAGRYDERPPRRPARVRLVAVVAGVIAAIGLGWVAWGMLQPSAEGEVGLSTTIDETRVELTLEVTRPVGTTAVCTIEAVNSGFGQVGIVDIVVEPSETRVSLVHVTMATSERATIAMVRSCEIA